MTTETETWVDERKRPGWFDETGLSTVVKGDGSCRFWQHKWGPIRFPVGVRYSIGYRWAAAKWKCSRCGEERRY